MACIDELDKMTDQDRSSLHEAMESQRISIAKAGITATLQCRCSLLAAANPKNGRFDTEVKIADQINLPPALMSRFDLMFVLRDLPDRRRDKDISSHILNSHMRGQALANRGKADADEINVESTMARTDNMKPPYKPEIIRKYVAYAKKNCFPIFTQEAYDTIQNDYLQIRGMGEDGSIPITARQLEAYVRLSEASATMHLRDKVTEEDARTAVRLVDYYLGKIARTGDGFDIDMAGGETTHKDRKSMGTVKDIIRRYTSTGGVTADIIAEETGLDKSMVFMDIDRLRDLNEIYENKGKYKLVNS